LKALIIANESCFRFSAVAAPLEEPALHGFTKSGKPNSFTISSRKTAMRAAKKS